MFLPPAAGEILCAPLRRAASRCPLTFVAVSDRVEVDVILLVGEEQKAEPGVKGVDGDYEEDPDDVPLFVWRAVVTKVHVDLKRREREEGWEGVVHQSRAHSDKSSGEFGAQVRRDI